MPGNEGSRVLFLFLIMFCLTITGCSRRYARRFVEPDGGTTARDLAQLYEQRIRSCRRLFTFTARKSVGSARGEGIFLYRQPRMYRLEIWDDMGNLIFHYIEKNGETEILMAEGGDELFSIDEAGESSFTGTGFTLDEMKSIGVCAFTVGSEAEYQDTGERERCLFSSFSNDREFRQTLMIDASTGMPLHYLVMRGGNPLREVSFEDIDLISDPPRPMKVKLIDHILSTTVTLRVTQESVNREIPESLFSTRGAGNS